MARHPDESRIPSRRTFLKAISWAPACFLTAPLQAIPFPRQLSTNPFASALLLGDSRVTPHYPTHSPLDAVLRLVTPGTDEFLTEKYAAEIGRVLDTWSARLTASPAPWKDIAELVDPNVEATSFVPAQELPSRSEGGIQVVRRKFSPCTESGRDRLLDQLRIYFSRISTLKTAEFQIVALEELPGTEGKFRVDIRYDLVGSHSEGGIEERIGNWKTLW